MFTIQEIKLNISGAKQERKLDRYNNRDRLFDGMLHPLLVRSWYLHKIKGCFVGG